MSRVFIAVNSLSNLYMTGLSQPMASGDTEMTPAGARRWQGFTSWSFR